jgi:hypothetical protein
VTELLSSLYTTHIVFPDQIIASLRSLFLEMQLYATFSNMACTESLFELKVRWSGRVARMVNKRNEYKILVVKA